METFPDGEAPIVVADAFLTIAQEEQNYEHALAEWNHHDDENLRRQGK